MTAFILLLTLMAAPSEPTSVDTIPDCCADKLNWTDLTGRERKLDAYRGQFVVLNFWATWCLPCLEELPELVEIQNRYGIYGVQVVGAAADSVDHRDAVIDLAQELSLNFPVLLGATSTQMELLGLGEAIPATVMPLASNTWSATCRRTRACRGRSPTTKLRESHVRLCSTPTTSLSSAVSEPPGK